MDLTILILQGIIVAATPLLFAAIGELVVEKSGVLNLGVEGMMIVGAIAGFAMTIESGSHLLGLVAAATAGAATAAIFAVLTQFLMSNQVATGLALTIFGLGVSALWGQGYSGQSTAPLARLHIPVISDLPIVGPLLFSHDILVYLSVALVVGVAWFLNRTRAGLILRAVGESHSSAHAIGYPVVKVRFLALLFGGACAGLGGAYLSLVQTPLWVEDMTAGRGWIALAIVVFATWKPGRAFAGAYLFGGVTVLQLHAQGFGVGIDAQYLSMLPYVTTVVVLVIISRDKARVSLNAPACLGKPFYASS
ncbi:ABC transporter permease [Oceanibacterium hippocampi]|uniref:Branched-chain amino acid transport system / permease component n=1 Tax=Oceanibacterium hippocampi TaxID=745714 RepID=A0A1Y5TXN2_9PROT|nr:ABC transporter permease [Oceanibacterium hippocampi]SLN76006.1 Branched-chain amino acid transport system / permease component [Oceanibacterium hippocampi]